MTDADGLPSGLGAYDRRLASMVRSLSGMTALFVGALTVVLAEAVAEALPLPEFYRALALFPVTLAVLSALVALAARYGGQAGGGGC